MFQAQHDFLIATQHGSSHQHYTRSSGTHISVHISCIDQLHCFMPYLFLNHSPSFPSYQFIFYLTCKRL